MIMLMRFIYWKAGLLNLKLTFNFQIDVARFLFYHIEDQRLKKNRDTDAVQTLVTELIIDHYKVGYRTAGPTSAEGTSFVSSSINCLWYGTN